MSYNSSPVSQNDQQNSSHPYTRNGQNKFGAPFIQPKYTNAPEGDAYKQNASLLTGSAMSADLFFKPVANNGNLPVQRQAAGEDAPGTSGGDSSLPDKKNEPGDEAKDWKQALLEIAKNVAITISFFQSDTITKARILQWLVNDGQTGEALKLLDMIPGTDTIIEVLRIRRLDGGNSDDSKATFLETLYPQSQSGTAISPRLQIILYAFHNHTLNSEAYFSLLKLPQEDQDSIHGFLGIRNTHEYNPEPVLYGFSGSADWRTFLRKASEPGAVPVAEGSVQARTVEYIRQARENVPERIRKNQVDKGKNLSYSGSKEAAKNPVPSQVVNEPDADQKRIYELIWEELKGEGTNSAVATDKTTGLILGHGFTTNPDGTGLGINVLSRFLLKNQESSDEFMDAGIAMENNKLLVVNTKDEDRKGLIEENKAAIAIINTDSKLLSLFIEVTEDPASAHEYADAQFEEIRKKGTAVTLQANPVLKTDVWQNNPRFVQFVAHCAHRGRPPWKSFLALPANKVTPQGLVYLFGITIAKEKPNLPTDKDIDPLGAMFVSGSETAELMGMALSAGRVPLALEAMGESQPLPEEMRHPKGDGKKPYEGFVFFRDDKKTTKQQSFYFRLSKVSDAGEIPKDKKAK